MTIVYVNVKVLCKVVELLELPEITSVVQVRMTIILYVNVEVLCVSVSAI